MQTLLQALSSSSVFAIAGWIAAGALALIGYFDRQRRVRRADDDQVASNLITNLKTTADLQEKELVALRGKEVEQGKEIAHLQGQVKVLAEILQGRDPDTKAILGQIPDIAKIAKHNGEAIEKLTNTMNQFMEKLAMTIGK